MWDKPSSLHILCFASPTQFSHECCGAGASMSLPEDDDDHSKGDDHGKCYSAKEQKVVQMGSSFISDIREKIVPTVEMMIGKVSPSVEAARGVFGSKDQQQNLAKRLVCYIVPPSGAAVAFGATLLGAQAAGAAVRISCATPVMASVVGCIAICTASVAAAQVSYSLRRLYGQEAFKRDNPYLSKDTLIVNALFGLVAFKVLGGKFHNLMPSNVLHPGALHSVSIPARGSKYANDIEQGLIQDIFKRHGCHQCGKMAGESIADHMPPNVVAYGRGWAKAARGAGEADSFLAWLRATVPFLSIPSTVVQQRLYPQCTDCMKLQSVALRHGKRAPLVFHFKRGMPEAPFFAGFCIGAMRMDDCDKDETEGTG